MTYKRQWSETVKRERFTINKIPPILKPFVSYVSTSIVHCNFSLYEEAIPIIADLLESCKYYNYFLTRQGEYMTFSFTLPRITVYATIPEAARVAEEFLNLDCRIEIEETEAEKTAHLVCNR